MPTTPQESSAVNTQFGLVESTGINPAAPLSDGDAYKPLLDSNGVLLVRGVSGGGGGGLLTTSYIPAAGIDQTSQYVVATQACTTIALQFFVRTMGPRYFQIHDDDAAISGGAVPAYVQLINGQREAYTLTVPVNLSTGMVVAISSTELTYTDDSSGFAVFGSYAT